MRRLKRALLIFVLLSPAQLMAGAVSIGGSESSHQSFAAPPFISALRPCVEQDSNLISNVQVFCAEAGPTHAFFHLLVGDEIGSSQLSTCRLRSQDQSRSCSVVSSTAYSEGGSVKEFKVSEFQAQYFGPVWRVELVDASGTNWCSGGIRFEPGSGNCGILVTNSAEFNTPAPLKPEDPIRTFVTPNNSNAANSGLGCGRLMNQDKFDHSIAMLLLSFLMGLLIARRRFVKSSVSRGSVK